MGFYPALPLMRALLNLTQIKFLPKGTPLPGDGARFPGYQPGVMIFVLNGNTEHVGETATSDSRFHGEGPCRSTSVTLNQPLN